MKVTTYEFKEEKGILSYGIGCNRAAKSVKSEITYLYTTPEVASEMDTIYYDKEVLDERLVKVIKDEHPDVTEIKIILVKTTTVKTFQ